MYIIAGLFFTVNSKLLMCVWSLAACDIDTGSSQCWLAAKDARQKILKLAGDVSFVSMMIAYKSVSLFLLANADLDKKTSNNQFHILF